MLLHIPRLIGEYSEKGYLCEKKRITYLIYNPIGNNVYTDPIYWKTNKVNITSKPIHLTVIDNITIEKYVLDQKQINKASDPNIICDLHFRLASLLVYPVTFC